MFRLSHYKYSVLSVIIMGAMVFLASCSKKDVVEGDPMASAGGLEGGTGEGAPVPPPVTTGGAGDAGAVRAFHPDRRARHGHGLRERRAGEVRGQRHARGADLLHE